MPDTGGEEWTFVLFVDATDDSSVSSAGFNFCFGFLSEVEKSSGTPETGRAVGRVVKLEGHRSTACTAQLPIQLTGGAKASEALQWALALVQPATSQSKRGSRGWPGGPTNQIAA